MFDEVTVPVHMEDGDDKFVLYCVLAAGRFYSISIDSDFKF